MQPGCWTTTAAAHQRFFHHPISDIEPVEPPANQIRAAQIKAVVLINQFGSIMQEALEGPRASVDHARTRLYAIGFALGCNFVGNTTLTKKARELNVTKAVLSRHATAFADATGLAPSFYLKGEGTRKTYAMARRQVVAHSKGSNGNGSASPMKVFRFFA